MGPLIGVGGGVVIAPMLNLAGVVFQTAAATSLFSIVVTAAVSLFNNRRIIRFRLLAVYMAMAAIAAVTSAVLSVKYSGDWIAVAYGVYLIAIGLVMLRGTKPSAPLPWLGYLFVFIGGFISSLFGVGGGTIFVPALVLLARFDPKEAAAMSVALIMPTAVAATLTYASFGVLNLPLAATVALGSFIGSYLSSRYVMSRLKSATVRKLFTAYVFAVGAYYLYESYLGRGSALSLV